MLHVHAQDHNDGTVAVSAESLPAVCGNTNYNGHQDFDHDSCQEDTVTSIPRSFQFQAGFEIHTEWITYEHQQLYTHTYGYTRTCAGSNAQDFSKRKHRVTLWEITNTRKPYTRTHAHTYTHVCTHIQHAVSKRVDASPNVAISLLIWPVISKWMDTCPEFVVDYLIIRFYGEEKRGNDICKVYEMDGGNREISIRDLLKL